VPLLYLKKISLKTKCPLITSKDLSRCGRDRSSLSVRKIAIEVTADRSRIRE
jgi:hypothetical protein